MYPQAVYFPIRTLYLTLKIEQRERYKSGELDFQECLLVLAFTVTVLYVRNLYAPYYSCSVVCTLKLNGTQRFLVK